MIKREPLSVSIPGKLFLAGEYAVVDGAPAVITAVDRYLTVTVRPTTTVGTVVSDQHKDLVVMWRREGDLLQFETSHPYALVEGAMRLAERYLQEVGQGLTEVYDLAITSQLDDEKSGQKYGLGSSGAVTVAVIKAILDYAGLKPSSLLLYQLSVLAQLELGLSGSFGDVAASSFGGILAYQRPDKAWLEDKRNRLSLTELLDQPWPNLTIESLDLPTDLTLLVGWTQSVALTERLVHEVSGKTREADKAKCREVFIRESQSCVIDLVSAFKSSDSSAICRMIRRNRELLVAYANQVGLIFETKALQELIRIAEQEGACAKTSGAGGGDCGFALVSSDRQKQVIRKSWERAGIVPLNLKTAPRLEM